MLPIAKEIAVSETAFLSVEETNLKCFIPEAELEPCGNCKLAVAHILKEQGKLTAYQDSARDDYVHIEQLENGQVKPIVQVVQAITSLKDTLFI